jgi:hypothetical protein
MTALSAVRTILHDVVRLEWRHGGGGRPTDGWQDKSAAFGPAQAVGRTKQFCQPVAFPCRRFQSTRQTFQHAHRHRQTYVSEDSLEHA